MGRLPLPCHSMRPATAIVVLALLALIGVAFTVWWFWLQSQGM